MKFVQKLEFEFRLAANGLRFEWLIYQKNWHVKRSSYLKFGEILEKVSGGFASIYSSSYTKNIMNTWKKIPDLYDAEITTNLLFSFHFSLELFN